jgi:paraquat-inducible protein B
MSKKANPTLIGAFVVGALALIIVAVIGLGGSEIFRSRPRAVAYFDGSVNGLAVGAPVTWLGVRIGSVTEVRMDLDVNRRSVRIPVFMEFEPERINIVGGNADLLKIRDLVAKGLRASLQQQSFVTGQLFVDLTMRPDTDAHLVGTSQFLVPEIPTVKSELDTLKEALEKLPLKDLGNDLIATLANLNRVIASPDTQKALSEMAGSATELHTLLGKLDGQGEPFPMLKETLDNLDKVKADLDTVHEVLGGHEGLGKDAHETFVSLNGQIGSTGEATKQVLADTHTILTSDVHHALEAAQNSFRAGQAALASIDSLVGPTSQQRADLDQILRNLAYTTQALRSFTEQIDRNPSVLLTGKK